jgi:peptide/nickel transport system substrate-binding protein
MRRFLITGAAALLAAALATACSSSAPAGSSGSNAGKGPSGTLTISNEQGTEWNCSFNPFNPGNLGEGVTMGQVYEPLAFIDTLENAKATPWLATSWAWSNGNRTLTFTIRKGVKFSDGTPMTAADVAFTFNLIKKVPALDVNSVWSVLSSVTQSGDNVVMTFKSPSVPYFYYIADQVPIVPEHIWSTISNPVTYADSNPVGTGAYVVKPCTPENITYVANPDYWQPGEPKVAKVLYPAFTSNDPANTYLATGQAQWGSQFIPNIQAFYTSKSPDNHYWFPPIANVSLIPNLTVPGLSNPLVRQAIAYAIDRSKVANIGEYGEEPAANQNDIDTPTFTAWMNATGAAKYNYGYNPAKAKQLLSQAGYTLGSNGIYAKAGQQLSFSVINIGGYSDWVASMSVIQQELKAVGIGLTPDNLAQNDFLSRLYAGQLPVRLLRPDRRPDAVLRAAAVAVLGELRADRQERGVQLGALQQPGDRHPAQRLRADHQHGHPAPDRERAPAGRAQRRAVHPDHRGSRLVPVQHLLIHWLAVAERPLRAAGRLLLPRHGPGAAAPRSEVTGVPIR